jgi:hypothetical protein
MKSIITAALVLTLEAAFIATLAVAPSRPAPSRAPAAEVAACRAPAAPGAPAAGC